MTKDEAIRLLEHFTAAYNTGDVDQFDHCLSEDYRHPNPEVRRGRQGMRDAVLKWRGSVEDLHLTVEDIIADGGKVVARMTFSGRHVGEVMGLPPTGKEFSIGLIDIFLVENGLFAQHWDQMDRLGLYRQLGGLSQAHVPGGGR